MLRRQPLSQFGDAMTPSMAFAVRVAQGILLKQRDSSETGTHPVV
jgi:hypothetical protein